jgi:hypothetical protein
MFHSACLVDFAGRFAHRNTGDLLDLLTQGGQRVGE